MTDERLVIRLATEEDARELFKWRNDPGTRKYFLHPEPVSWGEHVSWLAKTLKDGVPGRRLCVVEDADGNKVGMVRADESDGRVEISYTVAPAARGRGIGKQMVRQFVDAYYRGKPIIARILKGHVPSESVARSLGLLPRSEGNHEGRTFVLWS